MNKISSTGSVFTASEPWGPEHKESAWNIRPPEWWVENLPNWEFEFYSDYVLPHPTDHIRYKGFIATKLVLKPQLRISLHSTCTNFLNLWYVMSQHIFNAHF